MPRTATPAQKSALEALHNTHIRLVHDKAVLRAEVEAQLRQKIAELEDLRAHAARQAQALGVSKSDMLRAIGTTNYNTIYAILDRAGVATAEPVRGNLSILNAIERREDAWYVTSPDGCTMPLLDSLNHPRIDDKPGPEGQEWLSTPILPTEAWTAWFEANGDLIREHINGAA